MKRPDVSTSGLCGICLRYFMRRVGLTVGRTIDEMVCLACAREIADYIETRTRAIA